MQALANFAAPRYGGRLLRTGVIAASRIIPFAQGTSSSVVSYAGTRWSGSSSKWIQRQRADRYAQDKKVKKLRSRAAFKLVEMDAKYKLFKKGQTVVDLGYAPGSWSQVAVERTKPNGRVIGIDIIPVQPPKGVSAIQGNFLLPVVRKTVKEYLVELALQAKNTDLNAEDLKDEAGLVAVKPSYIDAERAESIEIHEKGLDDGKLVDVVLSDMMMNTSGDNFRDHAGSMDLCLAALQFASDTLRTGGHFVCKYYQGSEDKDFESKLQKMFAKVHREKPDSSRKESKENFFIALRRKREVTLKDVSS